MPGRFASLSRKPEASSSATSRSRKPSSAPLVATHVSFVTSSRVGVDTTRLRDDFGYTPFLEAGGLGRATQVFGDLTTLLAEINEVLAA